MFNSFQNPINGNNNDLARFGHIVLNSNYTYRIGYDPEILSIDCNNANRTIVLPKVARVGSIIRIINSTAASSTPRTLTIQSNDNLQTVFGIRQGQSCDMIFLTSNIWRVLSTSMIHDSVDSYGISLGSLSYSYSNSIAIGYGSLANSNSISIGYNCDSSSKDSAVAIGFNTKADRFREFVRCIDNASPQKYQIGNVGWYGETTDANATEIYLGGTASNRMTLSASSAFMFDINIVAYSNAPTEGATWNITGGIRRDGSNATSLIGQVNKTLISNDTGVTTWDVTVSADDTNESLKITVTGETSHTIRWIADARITECRF